ncbi:hypothetical protein Tco_1372248, partial [Tanacetum coccineum]
RRLRDGGGGDSVRRLVVVSRPWWWRGRDDEGDVGMKWCCGGGGCGGDVAAGVMMLSGSMVGCGMRWHGGGREWGELAGGRPKSRRKMGDGVGMLEKEERKISVCVSGYK